MSQKEAASLSVGDRQVPLEADSMDIGRDDPLIGKAVEVSPIAGGSLADKVGKDATVSGVIRRLGQVVGYEVKIKGETQIGTVKDFFVDREMLEDIQPPSPTSAAIREALSHWAQPRDYWHERTDGLEALCFELASATPRALPVCHPWGWQFLIPEAMPGQHTVADCRAILHGRFWTLVVSVYPVREPLNYDVPYIPDHWARTFEWTRIISEGMVKYSFPWGKALKSITTRYDASAWVLQPMARQCMDRCSEIRGQIEGETPCLPEVTAAFSSVRLKAGTVGLTEPPTDRRVYSVMSISPGVAQDRDYLRQVVLHECVHVAVASPGGDPHGDEFHYLAEKMGLKRKYRD